MCRQPYISLPQPAHQDIESRRDVETSSSASQWEITSDDPFGDDPWMVPDLSDERVRAMESLVQVYLPSDRVSMQRKLTFVTDSHHHHHRLGANDKDQHLALSAPLSLSLCL